MTFDLWGEQAHDDPLPILARMRAEAPVVRLFDPHQEAPEWMVTRYDDVVELLRDNRFSKDKRKLPDKAKDMYFRVSELDALDKHMLFSDPPEHTRLRSLVAKAFTPRRIRDLRPMIVESARRLLEPVRSRGEADVLEVFAFALPITVLAELMGVPVEDQDRFQGWTKTLAAPPDFDSLRRMAVEFHDYLVAFVDRRRREPTDDLTSALIEAEESGDTLDVVELISMLFLLIAAGYETTGNLIGNAVWALLSHPDQLERLRGTPALLESAVEEVLRFAPPVKNTIGAYPLSDVEFGGQVIPAGEKVVASLLSANHDPSRFADPGRFDITRAADKHLAFGLGSHFCLGAQLARLEAAVAIEALLREFPKLALADEPTRWKAGVFVHGRTKVGVTW
ncbi:cytochrome P450 [Allokutzneria sp. A3M-2-11 16]|uniref:cytochrome P450 family protein n=1 Tax=Allokutzneria sp. A3M-2-11 16 TaxID=2962043 RepID=UPI0020B86D0A|nr:cytochrome P450 [Allokutzneria sp. A3M-2-11 16]MCP3804307.1 cytochrome P450 [Allokutzneria sp. A3M-2-11 16]